MDAAVKYFDHGTKHQAAAILLTGAVWAIRTYLIQQGTYFDPPPARDGYPFGAGPMAWGMVAGLIICGGTFLYGLFDQWLGRYVAYRWLRWAVLSFWLAVAITVMIRFYALIADGTVVPDWSL